MPLFGYSIFAAIARRASVRSSALGALSGSSSHWITRPTVRL
jgi:hypothetical protein